MYENHYTSLKGSFSLGGTYITSLRMENALTSYNSNDDDDTYVVRKLITYDILSAS